MKTAKVKQPTFLGKVVALNGFIYDCSDHKQAEQITKTTKEISGYVGQEFGKGSDKVRHAVDNLELPTINPLPRPGADADEYDNMEFSGALKIWQA